MWLIELSMDLEFLYVKPTCKYREQPGDPTLNEAHHATAARLMPWRGFDLSCVGFLLKQKLLVK